MKNSPSNIPWLGKKLLQILVPDHKLDLIVGDFEEYLLEKRASHNRYLVLFFFWQQFLVSAPVFMIQSFRFRFLIFNHTMRMAARSLKRHLGDTVINLSGLSIGLASFLLIVLYVQHELSYDTFHEKSDRIYRVLDFRKVNGMGEESASAPTPLGENMQLDYPGQIEKVVRFFNFQAPTLALAVHDDSGDIRQFNETNLYFVDEGFFEVFDFPLMQGNPLTALKGQKKIVLSAAMAHKYFPYEDPMGKTLRFEDKHDFVVSGVLEPLPTNTHLNFDFLVSFGTLDDPMVLRERLRSSWIWNPTWTYLLLKPDANPKALENQFGDFVSKHFPESRKKRVKLYLQPLEDIHLHSNLDYEMSQNSDIIYIRIFSTIAIFILSISCINFINLVTAHANRRFGEIGMRKILGSNRTQLVWQLMHESFLLSLIAMVFAMFMVWMMLPWVNEMAGIPLTFNLMQDPLMFKWILYTYLAISLFSGLYPAISLSSVKPLQAVRGRMTMTGEKGLTVRKILVIGQFGLSMLLIVGTMVVLMQFNYLQKQKLGFDPEQVVLLPTLRSPIMDKYQTFKDLLLQNPHIHAVTTVEDIPGVRHQTGGYEAVPGIEQQFPRLIVHDDFVKTLGIELAAGKDFDFGFNKNWENVIINEQMVSELGWESPQDAIGEKFNNDLIVGVVKDFHFASLHNPIGPFVLERVADDPRSLAFSARYIAIRVESNQLNTILKTLEEQWQAFVPGVPFQYKFLGSVLDSQYEAESILSKLVAIFCLLSLFIACLGLYGLASYAARQRLKEIGIRKVMGASVRNLVLLLSSSFLKLVGWGVLLAWPVAYFILEKWLEAFAYRIDLNIWPFLISGALGFVVVFITVSSQAFKASLINPVDTLRNE